VAYASGAFRSMMNAIRIIIAAKSKLGGEGHEPSVPRKREQRFRDRRRSHSDNGGKLTVVPGTATLIDELMAAGDHDAADTWRRIPAAVVQLANTIPPRTAALIGAHRDGRTGSFRPHS
jgi:hypothetical protein